MRPPNQRLHPNALEKREATAAPSRARRTVRAVGRGVRRIARFFMWMLVVTVIITIITTVWGINTTRVIGPVSGPVVTDFTHLYRIEVGREIAPTQEAQIVQAMRTTSGPRLHRRRAVQLVTFGSYYALDATFWLLNGS